MIDLEKNVITVVYENETYVLRIPTPIDQIAIGVKQKEIMAKSYADFIPSDLDSFSAALLTGMATFERLITSGSTANWLWVSGKDGKPVVDSAKFPVTATRVVMEVTGSFQLEFDKFLYPRYYAEQSEQENMESKPDTAQVAV